MNESNGMSRAAKKRAKKKKRHSLEPAPQAASNDKQKDAKKAKKRDNWDGKETNTLKVPNLNYKKLPDKETIKEDDDNSNLDELHSSDDDDDEEVVMKKAAAAPNREIAALPLGCCALRDILLLEEKEDDIAAAFQSMTSRQRAHCALDFLLQPAGVSVADFYEIYWEKKPLHVKCSDTTDALQQQHRLDGFLSLNSIRSILQKESLFYGKDLNVTRYERGRDGVHRRVTLDKVNKTSANEDLDGSEEDLFVPVKAKDVWNHWDAGCTVRLLCPHKDSESTHTLLSLLELEFGCMVGANAYLTPPNVAQGFAPHYDDIEAFCLQLEGYKRWKVYAPLNKAERLPRTSSTDYSTAELKDVEPAMDVTLGPGDLLYMPRGWIHQACTLPEGDGGKKLHSLHLTVSAMQQWAWADLLEILLPEALRAATCSDVYTSLREGLPPRFLDFMGAMHDNREENVPDILKKNDDADDSSNTENPETVRRKLQDAFRDEAKKRIMRVAKEAFEMLDAACDQMGKRFLSDRLPPALTATEKAETNMQAQGQVKLLPNMMCRLVRPGIARLVLENGMAVLYHCADNSIVYHENPLSPMEFEMDDAPAIEQLLTTMPPHWIGVSDLIHDSIEDKVSVAQALFDEGILSIRQITHA